MGASSSTPSSSPEVQEQESLAASTGSLPFLRSAFSSLSSSSPPSLSQILSLSPIPTLTQNPSPNPNLSTLLSSLGPSITSLLFPTTEPQPSWLQFLAGYNSCCSRMPVSSCINLLFRVYAESCRRSGIPCKLDLHSDPDKVGGAFLGSDLASLFVICWVMEWSWRVGRRRKGEEEVVVKVPEVMNLVMSALGMEEEEEGGTVMERSVSAQQVQLWVIGCVPGMANCLARYVQERIKEFAAAAPGDGSLEESVACAGDGSSPGVETAFLLTFGRAWALSLTLRNTICEELSVASFPELFCEALSNILYRSSIHGKGLNRFWSNVEGYHGQILVLVSSSSVNANQSNGNTKRWVVGMLTEQGFENKETFYGNSGTLYAISPIFHSLSPSGKEKNFMYSHLHPAGRVYEAKPKPVGLAFGGTLGNERIFIDEDFSKVTIRHHAVDKTYQHGPLFPNQGFLPIEASVLEVEAWGFGGNAAKQQQDLYKKRETLFTEQRRKVDLKTFGNWEDSPEKMMMDMVTDPNAVRREDR